MNGRTETPPPFRDWRGAALLALGVAIIVLQWTRDFEWAARLTVGKVWPNRGLDAIARSADGAYGEDYRRYIEFLRDTVPEVATVIILRTSGLPQYESRAFLQYFLIPRVVIPCPYEAWEDCLVEFASPNTYFAYSEALPLPESYQGFLQQITFGPDLGLLGPTSEGTAP